MTMTELSSDFNEFAYVTRKKNGPTTIHAQIDFVDRTPGAAIAGLVDLINGKGCKVYFIAQDDWQVMRCDSSRSVRTWQLHVQTAAGAPLGHFDVYEYLYMATRYGRTEQTGHATAMPSSQALHDALDWQGTSHFRPRQDV